MTSKGTITNTILIVFTILLVSTSLAYSYERSPYFIRLQIEHATVTMPAGVSRVVFDTVDCPTCSYPSWRVFGTNLVVDSVEEDGITSLASTESQLSGVSISSTFAAQCKTDNVTELRRRFPHSVPYDTLVWAPIREKWVSVPDISVAYKLRIPDSTNLDSTISHFSTLGNVSLVSDVEIPFITTVACPQLDDSLLSAQWGLKKDAKGAGTAAVDAWCQVPNGLPGKIDATTPVRIGVIDQGVRVAGNPLVHPDLENRLVPFGELVTTSHGTEMAGIIAAEGNNTIGIAGVAYEAEMVVTNFLRPDAFNPDADNDLDALLAMTPPPRVINMSFGFLLEDFNFEAALFRANAQDVSLVASAGNMGNPLPSTPFTFYPAKYDYVIAVGAHNNIGGISTFSNRGCPTCSPPVDSFVTLSAPGENIITTTLPIGSVIYTAINGTSPAAAFVSGGIALAYGVDPSLTPARIHEALMTSAQPNGDPLKAGSGRFDLNGFLREIINSSASSSPQATNTSDSIPGLIITTSALASSFEALRDRRTAAGTYTFIETIENIDLLYSGTDQAARVKACIKDYFDTKHLEWVILGGDETVVPVRYVYNDIRGPGISSISDFYYACLDGDWDFDADGVWGEVEDSVDLVPEVSVGRIPIALAAEATDYFHKIVTYESGTTLDWQTNSMFLGSKLYADGDGREFSQTLIDTALPPSFQVRGIYDDSGSTNLKDSFFLSMNEGQGLVVIHSLAQNSTNFFARRQGGFEPISVTDVDNLLDNASTPSVVLSSTCWNTQLDQDNIGEHFIKSTDGGAVAFIATSYNDFNWPSLPMRIEFLESLFDSNKPNEVGKLLNLARGAIADGSATEGSRRHVTYGYTLYGDPQMRIWTETPKFSTHDQLQTMAAGFSIVDTILDATTGLPIVGAKVCLMKDPDYYEVTTTNANGVAVFWPNFTQTGTATFTATEENYVSSQSTIAVNQCSVLGDADNNCATFNIADVQFIIARIFSGGPAPAIANNADIDRSCGLNIADATYGIARIFSGGPAPLLGCVDSLLGHPKLVAGGGRFDMSIPDDFVADSDVGISSTRSIDMPLVINFNSTHRIHGLSLIVRLSDSSRASITNLTRVPMHWSQRDNYVKIGLVDVNARNMLEPGSGDILEISNGAEIVKVLATEINSDGSVGKFRPSEIVQVDDGVVSGSPGFSFDQNFPNPFNPETNFSFSLPVRARVKIEIFNVLGQKVSTLVDEDYAPGRHSVKWNSSTDDGKIVASGVYFAKFVAGEFTAKRKLVIMK